MAKPIFTYTKDQQHLRNCETRLNGLRIEVRSGAPYQAELTRIEAAYNDIQSRMNEDEYKTYRAHVDRVLTTAEVAAEAKALAEAMAENRDKPSI